MVYLVTDAHLRMGLTQHALRHVADAGLIEHDQVEMLAHLLFGAFIQAVLQVAASEGGEREASNARLAYRRLAEGLLLKA